MKYNFAPPQLVCTFKVSVLFTSVMLAISGQAQAEGWTYEDNPLQHNQSLYYHTRYTNSSDINPVFSESFSWDADSDHLTEEELANIAYTHGITVELYPDQTPSLTFRDFTASMTGFKAPNSVVYGIYTSATDTSFEGNMTVNNVHLSFDDLSTHEYLEGIVSDPSNLNINGSSFSFSNVAPSQSSLIIRGVSSSPIIQNLPGSAVNIESSDISISNTVADHATALYIDSYETVDFKNNIVTIENADFNGNVRGYYSISSNNVSMSGNQMAVTGGSFETLKAIDVTADNITLETLSVTNNHLTLTDVNSPNAEIAGVQLEGYSGQNYDAFDVSNNSVSLLNSNIGSLVVAYSDNGTDRHFFKTGNTTRFAGVNIINGELSGFDRMEYTVGAENKDKAVLTLNYTPIETASVKNVPTHTFDGTTIAVEKGTGIEDGINYKLVSVTGVDAQFTNTTVESESTFVNSEWNVDDFTLKDGETLEVRWGEEPGNPDVDPDPDPENPEVDPTPDPEPGTDPDTPVLDPDNPDHQTVTENSKTLSESLLGTVAFVNQGAEFIADEGLAAMAAAGEVGKLATFGAVHGGTSNYQTGSRVDVDGYSLAAGVSYQINPQWLIGGFIEAGWADSDSHVNGTKGEGDHDYYGLGLATRYHVNDAWYVDGSLRAGQASTEFTGVYAGDSAKYDSDALYVTAHVGTGYLFNLTDTINLDVYGRYLITYLDGDDVNLNNKYSDHFDMDSTVTHAVRVGTRLTGAFCPYAGWKLGLAYEHVFDGDAESAVNSLSLEVPSLEGDTGIMEVGVTMKPSLNSHWSMDIGAKGYVGDREGVTGSLLVRYAF